MESVFGPVTPWLLFAVIAGLIEVAKKIAAKEPLSWKFWLSIGLGLLLGGGFVIAEAGEITFVVLFKGLIYGLLTGLVPTGLYDIVTKRIRQDVNSVHG